MKISTSLFFKISGSIGNTTGAMGRGGAYLRYKQVPRDVKTKEQLIVRQSMAAAYAVWKNAKPEYRKNWNEYGASLIDLNSTNHHRVMSGWWAFAREYSLFAQAGQNPQYLIEDRKQWRGYIENYKDLFVRSIGKYEVYLPKTHSQTNNIIIFVSPTQRKTVNNYYGGYKFAGYWEKYRGPRPIIYIDKKPGRVWIKTIASDSLGRASRQFIQQLNIV